LNLKQNQIILRALVTTALVLGSHGSLPAQQADNSHEDMPEKYYGESGQLGTGEARTYVTLTKDRKPETGRKAPIDVGVEFPAGIMNSLPADTQIVNINFPVQARGTPIQFMMLGWNPHGHPPAGVYDRPHLDLHFYIQDFEDVMAIDPGDCSGLACDDYARAIKPVPPQFLPEGYSDIGEVAPMMGNHLSDLSAPEFNGKPFTQTFIYGAYDGQITFFEPMITNETLLSSPCTCTEVKLPHGYSETGYEPTKYCREFDAGKQVIRVFLSGFVYHTAPN
jgi:hypothetical protein